MDESDHANESLGLLNSTVVKCIPFPSCCSIEHLTSGQPTTLRRKRNARADPSRRSVCGRMLQAGTFCVEDGRSAPMSLSSRRRAKNFALQVPAAERLKTTPNPIAAADFYYPTPKTSEAQTKRLGFLRFSQARRHIQSTWVDVPPTRTSFRLP
jgi:hypothetical protein